MTIISACFSLLNLAKDLVISGKIMWNLKNYSYLCLIATSLMSSGCPSKMYTCSLETRWSTDLQRKGNIFHKDSWYIWKKLARTRHAVESTRPLVHRVKLWTLFITVQKTSRNIITAGKPQFPYSQLMYFIKPNSPVV